MDQDPRRSTRDARAGDKEAVASLLARHLPSLRAFVRLNAGPALRAREAKSDLVQTVCREILERRADFEFRGEASFKAWLYTTARRKIIDRARFWQSERRAAAKEVKLDARGRSDSGDGSANAELLACYATFCTPSQEAMVHEEQERIERAFTKLPVDQRRVITLARIAGLSHAQIALELERNENAVRQLLFRALANLAIQLDRTRPPPPRPRPRPKHPRSGSA